VTYLIGIMVSLHVCNGWRGAGIGLHGVLLRTGQGSITGRGVKIYPLASCVQTSSEAHPASCPVGTGGLFPGVKLGRGVTLTIHPIFCRGQE
jgi:hypothetical protein